MLIGFCLTGHEFFNMPDGMRGQKRIRAYVTYFGGNILKNEYIATVLDGMDNNPMLIFPGTSLNTAFHWAVPL